MTADSIDDHALAHHLATKAGEMLVLLRAEMVADRATTKELRDEGDARSHRLLMDALAEERPHDAVLSEESDDESGAARRARNEHSRVWIVDPLDGTREFGEPPRTDWAVHVALAIDGRPLVGAVALPAMRSTLSTVAPATLHAHPNSPPRVVVSRSRPPAEALMVAAAIDAELVEMGSAGAKAMAVVRGDVDVYPHSGGQYEWDSCAPVAVALAAGLWCSRLDGSELVYNRPDPYLPDLVISRRDLAPAVLEAIAG